MRGRYGMADNIYQQSFWDDEDGEMWDDIAETMLEIYLTGIEGGVDALPPDVRVLVDWDRVNTDALGWAKQYRYDLIKGITDTTRRQVQTAVSDWIASGSPLDALEAVLSKTFGPVRANMISITEVTRIFAEANAAAWKSTGLVEQVRYNTAVDDKVCPICSPLNGQNFPVDDYGHKPPLHIRCRCYNTPVVSIEALEQRLDEILS